MVSFDMRTIMFSFLLTNLISTIVIFILWIQFHRRYNGTGYLVFSFALQTLGLLLIDLRGTIPEWISVDLSNTMIIAGILLGYIGLEAYTGKKSIQIHNIILLVIFAFIHTWFTIFKPDLTARNLNISVTSFIIFFQCSWLMLIRVPRKFIRLYHSIGIVFLAFCLVSLANILKFLGGKVMPPDYFDAGRFDTVAVTVYHMLVILLTYSLVMMFSKNLLLDFKSEEMKSILANQEKNEEQKKYIELVNYERNLLKTVIDNLPDPVSIKDSEGRFLLNNNAHLEVLGADCQKEALGKTIFDYLPAEEAEYYDDADKNVMLSRQIMLDKVESYINSETGFHYWYLTSRIPIPESEGTPAKLLTISHDITVRKRAEDALKETAELNRSLLKTIPFGMDIVDEEGNILFQSENFKTIFKTNSIGKKCWDFYRDDKKQCSGCPLINGIEIGKTAKYEIHGALGGRVFDIYHTGMIYMGKRAMLEIFHEITEHKQAEDQLIRSKEQAEESDRLKTAFLHNISHEIRTPMNAIVGFTTLLGEPDIKPEDHNSYLDIITQSSNHLISIVTDIIEISNIEAGKLKLNLGKVNISNILENLHRQFSQIAVRTRLDFELDLSQSADDELFYTDSTKLIQVLSNLLNNAFKFTHSGSVKFGYKRHKETVELFVTDTGIGIPLDQQEKIFERFYQVDSKESRQYEGTGLGLSLSKAYIEIMGGKLWVESEAGKGSSFYISLPC
jgi:PAS domain S-box-containing protein